MKTVSETSSSPEDICRQAAKVFAGEDFLLLRAKAKQLVCLLEEQNYLEPRGDNAFVGRVVDHKPDTSTQMDLLHHAV